MTQFSYIVSHYFIKLTNNISPCFSPFQAGLPSTRPGSQIPKFCSRIIGMLAAPPANHDKQPRPPAPAAACDSPGPARRRQRPAEAWGGGQMKMDDSKTRLDCGVPFENRIQSLPHACPGSFELPRPRRPRRPSPAPSAADARAPGGYCPSSI